MKYNDIILEQKERVATIVWERRQQPLREHDLIYGEL